MSKKWLQSWMWLLTIPGWFSAEISEYRSDLEVVGIFSSFCGKKTWNADGWCFCQLKGKRTVWMTFYLNDSLTQNDWVFGSFAVA